MNTRTGRSPRERPDGSPRHRRRTTRSNPGRHERRTGSFIDRAQPKKGSVATSPRTWIARTTGRGRLSQTRPWAIWGCANAFADDLRTTSAQLFSALRPGTLPELPMTTKSCRGRTPASSALESGRYRRPRTQRAIPSLDDRRCAALPANCAGLGPSASDHNHEKRPRSSLHQADHHHSLIAPLASPPSLGGCQRGCQASRVFAGLARTDRTVTWTKSLVLELDRISRTEDVGLFIRRFRVQVPGGRTTSQAAEQHKRLAAGRRVAGLGAQVGACSSVGGRSDRPFRSYVQTRPTGPSQST